MIFGFDVKCVLVLIFKESMKELYDKVPSEDADNDAANGDGAGKKRADKQSSKVSAVFVETPIQNEIDVDVSTRESAIATSNVVVEETAPEVTPSEDV